MTKPLFLARLVGTQAEMGAQHGRLVADDARRLLAFYRTMPERTLAGDMPAIGRWVARSVAQAWQARLARDRPAELAARTRAFVEAAGAEDPDEAVRTFATMDALQNCIAVTARANLGPFTTRALASAIPACSTLIAWGDKTHDGELLFGRNFDFPGIGVWDEAPAFVACVPARGQAYGFFTTRGADAPVVTVVNEAGLVLAPHTRFHTGVTWGGAMIVDLVHAIAARAETLADAIAIARERPVSSSWGIAVGSARERSAIVLEIAGPRVEVVRPAPGAQYLACANRYRTAALQPREITASPAWEQQSEHRERALRRFAEAGTRLTAQDIARMLGDRDAHGARRRLGSILAQPTNVHCAVIAPAHRLAHVGVDRAPVCEGQWAEIAWDWRGASGAWEIGAAENSGFTAKLHDAFVAPHDLATRELGEATRIYETSHDVVATLAAIERAIAAAPEDPSLRLAGAWLALEGNARDRAVRHVHEGLATERDPYRRGQLLLWGSRAATGAQAARWREELSRLDGDGVAALHAAARKRHRARPHINLMMAEAY